MTTTRPAWTLTEATEHFPIDINAFGQGPEADPALVVAKVCWSCLPEQAWPCKTALEQATVDNGLTPGHDKGQAF
ncbi:hypothetical protein [Arthrobacter cavernae]|uniref:Uncharacterized protein n=1 Tax=Arthrobacter cavernae TaxID=2817681 RepID=A0A939HKW2_9MICC|nr:hypothetical protein [Arthrobacter cavernae]MBO1269902.1 hypothetical protein [Arthrobacter cavernae]